MRSQVWSTCRVWWAHVAVHIDERRGTHSGGEGWRECLIEETPKRAAQVARALRKIGLQSLDYLQRLSKAILEAICVWRDRETVSCQPLSTSHKASESQRQREIAAAQADGSLPSTSHAPFDQPLRRISPGDSSGSPTNESKLSSIECGN